MPLRTIVDRLPTRRQPTQPTPPAPPPAERRHLTGADMERWLAWGGVSSATMLLELHQLAICLEASHQRLTDLRTVDRDAGDEARQIDVIVDELSGLIDGIAFLLDPCPADTDQFIGEERAA